MFLINELGRIVGLPENMEEAGFKQAREVLSVSDSLMDNGNYVQATSKGALYSKSGGNLLQQILEKFPNVIRDSEYLNNLNKKEDESTKRTKATKISGARQKNR